MNIYNNRLYRYAENSIRAEIAKLGGTEGYITNASRRLFWGYVIIITIMLLLAIDLITIAIKTT